MDSQSTLGKILSMQQRLRRLQKFHDSLCNSTTSFQPSLSGGSVVIKDEPITDDEADAGTTNGSDSDSSGFTTNTNTANYNDLTPSDCPSSEDLLHTIYNSALAGRKKIENVRKTLMLMKILAYLCKPFINDSQIFNKLKLYTRRLLFIIGLYNVFSFGLHLCEK